MFEAPKAVTKIRSIAGKVRTAGLVAIFFLVPASIMVSAQAQDRDDRTLSCQSTDGQRTFCPADLRRGPVQMIRQLGDVRCVEGSTWGRQDGGVWVDRGCRAEFVFEPGPPRRMEHMTRIESGTVVPVRTNETVSANRADGRIFTGSVDRDVIGNDGQVAIPRGASVELIVRVAHDDDLILDLESVMIDGQRYAINAGADRLEAIDKDTVGANERTGKFVGGGAIIGAILGAAVGGGKGAAIGAGVGAGAGAASEIATSGREVRIPAESVVTFRLNRALAVDVPDEGSLSDGNHYHRGN